MRLFAALVHIFAAAGAFATPLSDSKSTHLRGRAISTSVYDNLVFYYQYASTARVLCLHPNNNTLVIAFSQVTTDMQGFIVRDDIRKEIVIAFRKSTPVADITLPQNVELVRFSSSGVRPPSGVSVHNGFLTAWNSVSSTVISNVRSELNSHPGYAIVTSGHSLGGAVSSLAGITLKRNFPNVPVRIYTYGQPRTGNQAYANFVHSEVGAGNIFRGVHTTDIVPKTIATSLGYAHHGTEFWTFADPSSAASTNQCNASGEDASCSAGSTGGDVESHLTYYNIPINTAFCG